MYFTTH